MIVRRLIESDFLLDFVHPSQRSLLRSASRLAVQIDPSPGKVFLRIGVLDIPEVGILEILLNRPCYET